MSIPNPPSREAFARAVRQCYESMGLLVVLIADGLPDLPGVFHVQSTSATATPFGWGVSVVVVAEPDPDAEWFGDPNGAWQRAVAFARRTVGKNVLLVTEDDADVPPALPSGDVPSTRIGFHSDLQPIAQEVRIALERRAYFAREDGPGLGAAFDARGSRLYERLRPQIDAALAAFSAANPHAAAKVAIDIETEDFVIWSTTDQLVAFRHQHGNRLLYMRNPPH